MVSQHIPPEHSDSAMMQQSLWSLISGTWSARAIQIATQLGIADLLTDSAQPVAHLAQATQTHAHALSRLLRYLSSLGIFAEVAPQMFANTERSCYLRAEHPKSVRGWALFLGSDWNQTVWRDMTSSIRTGAPVPPTSFGMDAWDYLSSHPQESEAFAQYLTSFSHLFDLPLAMSYDFSSFATLTDVAGNRGDFLFTLLGLFPSLHGILFDLPEVIDQARELAACSPYAHRCSLQAGSFFEELPAGSDAYFLKFILHNWGDEQCLRLLRACCQAMGPTSKLLVADLVLDATSDPSFATLIDLAMLVYTDGGRERTEQEFRALFSAAGLELVRVIPTSTSLSLIEAVRR